MTTLINSISAQTGIPYIPAAGGATQGVVLGASGTVLTSTGTSSAPTFQLPTILSPQYNALSASGTAQIGQMNAATSASQITITLPSVIPVSSLFYFASVGTGLFVLQLAAGQTVVFSPGASTSTAGTITATAQYQVFSIYCIVANTQLILTNIVGGSLTHT